MLTQKQQSELNRIGRREKPLHPNCIGVLARRGFVLKSDGVWRLTADGATLNELLNRQ